MAGKKELELDFTELLDKVGTREWQECVVSRLEPLRAYLSQDEWQKGISIYLKASLAGALKSFLIKKRDEADGNYLRGFAAALQLVIALPSSIEAQIQQQQAESQTTKDRGTAGY
jgi:hypothetical protein